MVVTVGDTEGLAEVEVNPVGFDVQEYVLPLTVEAPIVVLPPLQIILLEPTFTVGKGFTVTVTESAFEQPVAEMVCVKIYLVVVVGATLGLAEVEVNPLGFEVHE